MRDPAPASERVDTRANHSVPDVMIGRLKRRADFLHAAKGRRWHGKAFSLQAGPAVAETPLLRGPLLRGPLLRDPPVGVGVPGDVQPSTARVGFTVTKKVGCSVIRNRVRRRLREALRLAEGLAVEPGHDYVLVARIEAIRLPFKTLQNDLFRAIRGVHPDARSHDAAKRPARHSRHEGRSSAPAA